MTLVLDGIAEVVARRPHGQHTTVVVHVDVEARAAALHLGPLLSVEKNSLRRRIALGCGLIGLQRSPATNKWRLFLFDFSSKSDNTAPSATSP